MRIVATKWFHFKQGSWNGKRKLSQIGLVQTNNCQCGKDQIEPSLAGFLVNKELKNIRLRTGGLFKESKKKKK